MSPLGLTLFSEKHRNRGLTSGNRGCAELRVPEEMDRSPVPFGQSDHWEDSTRKPKRGRSNAFGGEKGLTNRSASGAHTRRPPASHRREVTLTVRGFTPGGSGTASTDAIAISAPRTHTMGEFDFIPACEAIAKPEGRLGPSCRGPTVTAEQGNAS
jgi:hypothetical protein